MKCWKCEQENTQGASQCVHCGISLERSVPITETGAALRQLYDHYGAEALLTNPLLMVNGLGDLLQDSGKFRNQLKMAMEAGIGKIYLQQIRTVGKPDPGFTAKIQKILTADAELSEAAAQKIINSFDEMIGWSVSVPVQKDESKEIMQPGKITGIHREDVSKSESSQSEENKKENIKPATKTKIRMPLIVLAVLVIVAGFLCINESQRWIQFPWNNRESNRTEEISSLSSSMQTQQISDERNTKIGLPYNIKPGMTPEEANKCMEHAGFICTYTDSRTRDDSSFYTHYTYESSTIYGYKTDFTTLTVESSGHIDVGYHFSDENPTNNKKNPGEVYTKILSIINNEYGVNSITAEDGSDIWINSTEPQQQIYLTYYRDGSFAVSYHYIPF